MDLQQQGDAQFSLGRRMVSEALSTGLYILIGEGALANALLPKTKGQSLGPGWVAVTFGLAIFMTRLALAHVSAIINTPATLALAVLGRLRAVEFLALAAAQFTGAFVGACMVWLTYLPHFSTVPEPPAETESAALLRTRDTIRPVGLELASYCTQEPVGTVPEEPAPARPHLGPVSPRHHSTTGGVGLRAALGQVPFYLGAAHAPQPSFLSGSTSRRARRASHHHHRHHHLHDVSGLRRRSVQVAELQSRQRRPPPPPRTSSRVHLLSATDAQPDPAAWTLFNAAAALDDADGRGAEAPTDDDRHDAASPGSPVALLRRNHSVNVAEVRLRVNREAESGVAAPGDAVQRLSAPPPAPAPMQQLQPAGSGSLLSIPEQRLAATQRQLGPRRLSSLEAAAATAAPEGGDALADQDELGESSESAATQERQLAEELYDAAVRADQNAKLAVFSSRPAILAPVLNCFTETIATTTLVLLSLLVADQRDAVPENLQELYRLALEPLFGGLITTGLILGLGGATGFVVSPVRDIAPRFAHALLPIPGKGPSEFHYVWVTLFGPLLGGLLGAGLYQAVGRVDNR